MSLGCSTLNNFNQTQHSKLNQLSKKVWEEARRRTDREALDLAKVLGYELPMNTTLGLLTVESAITPHGKRFYVVQYSEHDGEVTRTVLEFAHNSSLSSMSFDSAWDALRAVVDARFHRPTIHGYIVFELRPSRKWTPKKGHWERFLSWIQRKLGK